MKDKSKGYDSLEYRHQTLTKQLDGGVRQLELDIGQDAKGGRFAHPKIVKLTKQAGITPDPDFDPLHAVESHRLTWMEEFWQS